MTLLDLPNIIKTQFLKLSQPYVLRKEFDRPKATYLSDDKLSDIPKPTNKNPYYDQFFPEVFGSRANDFNDILYYKDPQGIEYGENRSYNPNARNFNSGGTEDRGLFQINSDTFNDFKRRYPKTMASNKIASFDDMYDPYKNAVMANIIFNEQGFGAWYGAPPRLRYGNAND
jgi:hypothetical protein